MNIKIVGTFLAVTSISIVQAQHVEKKHKNNKERHIEDSLSMVKELESVNLQARKPIESVRQSAYNVVAIDAKPYYNTTMDLAELLNKASGIKVRNAGGVGSQYNITLNGFTGRHVKVFLDGVPMEGMGSAFQLNNIPINIADRIEIYKGVVPIEFGSDAIGGVINIVTKKGKRTHLDASYSYGSFNTHKSNLDFGMTNKDGFTFNINAFQNYSDNSYKVWMEEIKNVNTGVYENNPQWVKRFHDNYHNETLVTQAGFVNKKWADRLMLGLTLGKERADIQNAYIMKIVYGKRFRKGSTIMPNLSYQKNNLFTKGLHAKFNVNYSKNYNQNVDTASRSYNWLGQYSIKKTQGEGGVSTLAEFNNYNWASTANLTYHIGGKHSISVNNVYNHFSRQNADQSAIITDGSQAAQYMKRNNYKDIVGLSYKLDHSTRWNTSIFGKYYTMGVTSPVNIAQETNQYKYEYQNRTSNLWGYGLATTYFIKEYLQVKASYEKAARLPTDNELFGDQVLVTENPTLRPERSNNINLGISYNKEINELHSLYADFSVMYRYVYDYIRQVVQQQYGTQSSVNHGKVSNLGWNAELKYYYKKMFSIGGNFTYQNLRNKEKTTSPSNSTPSVIYNDRLPNMPYIFGNTDVSVYLQNVGKASNSLTITYNNNYIHSFYLNWPSLGDADSKFIIPKQFSHDLLVSMAFVNGKYNVGLEARNFTNQKLYDNWSLQKPGRNFAIKLRYHFNK